MAIKALSGGMQPLSAFDVLNTQASSLKGGEVMTLGSASRVNSSTETAAPDVLDGYALNAGFTRTVAQLATAAVLPVFLADEGTAGYFTMLGTVVGANAGMVLSGSALGPHTSAGSGKVTLWDKPGLYEVSTDALDSDFVSGLGAAGLAPGAVIGHTSGGLLQHSQALGAVASTGVAEFVEFSSSPSLVTTPARLVGATVSFDRITVLFHAGWGDRTVAA